MTTNMITKEQFDRLRTIDTLGAITSDDAKVLPGIHFCPEWDELPIFKGCPEWECCLCDIKETIDE